MRQTGSKPGHALGDYDMLFIGNLLLILIWLYAEYKELQRVERVEKIAEVIK